MFRINAKNALLESKKECFVKQQLLDGISMIPDNKLLYLHNCM